MNKEKFIGLLKKEMVMAMGCTEPAASALAGAKARDLLGESEIEKIEIYASRDMVKNTLGVGLPDCDLKGIQAAVTLGIAEGKVEQGLGILSGITESQIKKAQNYNVELRLVSKVPALFISVKVYGPHHTSQATISGEHEHFVVLLKDEQPVAEPLRIISSNEIAGNEVISQEELSKITLDEIIEVAKDLKGDEGDFLKAAVETNLEISRYSLDHCYGLCVGKTEIENMNKEPSNLAEAFHYASSLAAAGSDARMAGCSMPVIINSGSGNQGITVTVPLKVLADYLKVDEKTYVESLFIAQMVGLTCTARKNRLSAMCGAFTAAIATSCAYVYLLGGERPMMDCAVNTMVGNLTGIICDGAKMTCSLKIYSCLEAAALSCRLAFKGHSPGIESGIVGKDSLESITYLSRISSEGMSQTDDTILSIMLNKQKC
ncbi:MAG: L-serine ammonia-lyase, iron-sulfur-dependent, subunit alpha [Sphaerochaetaceae bacterium]|nr:L-serine ammonia-lyase, iron-sulfur-dependent, subunit alpha [Sphaerochaetaceae bacterium]